MQLVNKSGYRLIKSCDNINGSGRQLDRWRRWKSQSLFFVVFIILVSYIVLSVLLTNGKEGKWLSFYKSGVDYYYEGGGTGGDGKDKEVPTRKEEVMGSLTNLTMMAAVVVRSTTFDKVKAEDNPKLEDDKTEDTTTSTPIPVVASSSSKTANVTDNLPENLACQIPKLDPYDASIAHLIKNATAVNCTALYPLLFESFPNSVISPVTEAIKKRGWKSCCYRAITRKSAEKSKKPDEGYVKGKECVPMSLEKDTVVPSDMEFLGVYCIPQDGGNNTSNSSTVKNETITDMFTAVQLKPEVEERITAYYENLTAPSLEEREKVNVVMLGIDAVSHMNFLRAMPQSYRFLRDNLSAVEMQGYNKIGDNTYPNLAAVLTSLTTAEMADCEKNDFFDACPFLWKDFASHGYRTSFAEDSTWMGIFNYLTNGFKFPPTDYYFRPFGNALDSLIGTNKRLNTKMCHGPRLAFQGMLHHVQKLAWRMGHHRRYFSLLWTSSLTHDYLNDAQLGDPYLLETLEWFENGGYLNETVLILMSDHGIRWGPIHDYVQGEVEERLPFLYFVAPLWFRERYSKAWENLQKNGNRLTTPFDLHQTLKDLLDLRTLENLVVQERQQRLDAEKELRRGISQFLEIPGFRTCAMAGVEGHYCTCHETEILKTEESMVQQVANFVVFRINELIKGFSGCAFLSLKEVKRAALLRSEISRAYEVVVETSPGGAVFQSSVERGDKGEWKVSGTISRTNLYGNQSHCVEEKEVKLYCYCVDLM